MSRDKYNMLQYTVALVSEFSAHFGISQQQALNYLVRFKGGGASGGVLQYPAYTFFQRQHRRTRKGLQK